MIKQAVKFIGAVVLTASIAQSALAGNNLDGFAKEAAAFSQRAATLSGYQTENYCADALADAADSLKAAGKLLKLNRLYLARVSIGDARGELEDLVIDTTINFLPVCAHNNDLHQLNNEVISLHNRIMLVSEE